MNKDIKLIEQCKCYTTIVVKGKRHVVPTLYLAYWLSKFEEELNGKEESQESL